MRFLGFLDSLDLRDFWVDSSELDSGESNLSLFCPPQLGFYTLRCRHSGKSRQVVRKSTQRKSQISRLYIRSKIR